MYAQVLAQREKCSMVNRDERINGAERPNGVPDLGYTFLVIMACWSQTPPNKRNASFSVCVCLSVDGLQRELPPVHGDEKPQSRAAAGR